MYPYMIFSRSAGPEEGAFLVFAHTIREARRIGWAAAYYSLVEEFIDLGCQRIWRSEWLFKEADLDKLQRDEAHVIEQPKSCDECLTWGISPIGEDGLCEECRDDRELEEHCEVI